MKETQPKDANLFRGVAQRNALLIGCLDGQSSQPACESNEKRIVLPPGVTEWDWSIEKSRFQNPRIRSVIGCIRLVEEALDSNYTILHCTRPQLLKTWHQVRRICKLIHCEISPALKESSILPGLDAAIRKVEESCDVITKTVISDIERYPDQPSSSQLPGVRKLLCVSIGKIYTFLRNTLGEILANDPRSQHDTDYFLSRRFAKDIEESEWLYSSVFELREWTDGMQRLFSARSESLLMDMEKGRMIPNEVAWGHIQEIIQTLLDVLVPKLKEVLSHSAVRLKEIESLDMYTFQIQSHCVALVDIYEVGKEVIEGIKSSGGESLGQREQIVSVLTKCHGIINHQMIARISALGDTLANLAHFVPVWMAGIEKRRCLMLSKLPREAKPLQPDRSCN